MHPGTLKAARDASSGRSQSAESRVCALCTLRSGSSISDPGKELPLKVGPFLINMIFESSFPVEMFGESGSCTGVERLQIHGCWHGTGLCVWIPL